jgi:hypothetical protein
MSVVKNDERDLESERQALLVQMEAAIAPDIKRQMEEVVLISARGVQLKVSTSHSGAADANPS